ncbi:hypothetical protein AAVH_07266 [Aphelenchoides avenae]|nr:hypothetical protein AAVH_07266 [Aphelenchus avenae]
MLPNDMLLDVLPCADYKTLVLAKLSQRRFLLLVTGSAAQLAHRRRFVVIILSNKLVYVELPTGATRTKTISYEDGNRQSLAASCQELDGVIGPHAVVQVSFFDYTWNTPDVGVVFEAAPPLKYAERVDLCRPPPVPAISGVSEEFVNNFAGIKELRLYLDYDVVAQFDWAFLRAESARNLRRLKFPTSVRGTEADNRFAEELIRNCITLPRLRGGEPLELDFSARAFSGAFGRRIVELLEGTGCELILRVRALPDGELLPDEGDYTVDTDADGTTTRYASEQSGIVVEVKGDSVTIRSTAVVPRKKPRMN